MDYVKTLEHLSKVPSMYVSSVTYDTITAFVDGLNMGLGDILLEKIREWLFLKYQAPYNFAYSFQIKYIFKQINPKGSEKELIDFYFSIINKFIEYRDEFGVTKIIEDFDSAWEKYLNDTDI